MVVFIIIGGFTAAEFRAADVAAKELLDLEMAITDMQQGGYTSTEMRKAGCSARERGSLSPITCGPKLVSTGC